MFKKMKEFKFQGLAMELTLIVVNVLLVLGLVFMWSNHIDTKQAEKERQLEYQYSKVGTDTQGTK